MPSASPSGGPALVAGLRKKLEQGSPIGVLFVCLGNICRSPAAEAVFRSMAERKGMGGSFLVDSVGTGGGAPNWYRPGGHCYAEGGSADSRMVAVAKTRGYSVSHVSRRLNAKDIQKFDVIIGMEKKNRNAVLTAAEFWGGDELLNAAAEKTVLLPEFITQCSTNAIPDPYHRDDRTFEKVLDMVEDGCEGLLGAFVG